MNRRRFIHCLGAGGASSVPSAHVFGALLAEENGQQKDASARLPSLPEASRRARRISVGEYKDRVYGAWLGGIVGTLFGFPFEGQARNAADHLDHYLRSYSHAPVDDDYYYEMVALYGFERHGIAMTVEQLGEMWKEYQAGTWGSSEQARLALEKGIKAPDTGSPKYNRWFHTIGPQFSSDLYGMITPGMINLAGSTARQYSHVNGYAEGSDGAVFVAGCISEAFFETDAEKIVRQSASLISPKSNYRKALDQVLTGFSRHDDWREVAREVEDRWRPDYPQLNNSVANGALVALALLYGQGDYLKSLNMVTAADDYTDADCNGDNVGSIVGAMHGVKAIPAPMVATLHDRICGNSMGPLTYNQGVDERISDLAARIAAVGIKLLLARGAEMEAGHLVIPQETPKEQPLEWFDINDYGKLWNPTWTLSHAGRGGAGATYLQWEDHTLVTFPRDTRPCLLAANLKLPSGHPELSLIVGSVHDGPWRLQVFANDEALSTEVIQTDAPGPEPAYRNLRIDLSEYAGQLTRLRLYHWLLEGKPPGSAFWRKAGIQAA
jgi:ADP-ribosylglycohydrolase